MGSNGLVTRLIVVGLGGALLAAPACSPHDSVTQRCPGSDGSHHEGEPHLGTPCGVVAYECTYSFGNQPDGWGCPLFHTRWTCSGGWWSGGERVMENSCVRPRYDASVDTGVSLADAALNADANSGADDGAIADARDGG
jgi:hypothetical protein